MKKKKYNVKYKTAKRSHMEVSHKGICKTCVYACQRKDSRWCIKRNGTLPKSKKFKQCEHYKKRENQ